MTKSDTTHHVSFTIRADQYQHLARLAEQEHTSIAFQLRKWLDARLPKQKVAK